MSDVVKINVGGVDVNIKDATAREQIETVKNTVKSVKNMRNNNKFYVSLPFNPYNNVPRSQEYVEKLIELLYVRSHVRNCVLLVHIGADGTITDTMQVLRWALDYAAEIGMNIDTLKFHMSGGHSANPTLYMNTVLNVLGDLATYSNIKNVFVFNEDKTYFIQDNVAQMVTFINRLKNDGYRVGIPCDYETFKRLTLYSEYEDVLNAIDIIGYNRYIPISTEGSNAHSKANLWSQLSDIKAAYNKDFWISETGVGAYMEALRNPADWTISGAYNAEAVKIYWDYFFNSQTRNCFDAVALWYIESFYNRYRSTGDTELFDYLGEWLVNGGDINE